MHCSQKSLMSAFAPVVIFAYRRPEHLRNTLASLMRCDGFDESPVIVYCDGARDESELALVMATREVAEAMLGIRAEYRFSDTNQGLSRSVISGISETVERFGRVIVVEDDLELSVSFLTFMNRALEKYADEENIFQISGYQFNVPELRSTTTAIFLPFTVSWGWATWKRAWDKFDPLATGWNALIADKTLRLLFNLDGTYDYANMLVRQMEGYRDSWAIRWYWSVFTMNGLVLFPPVSLVKNMGFDGSGSHGRGVLRRFATRKTVQPSFFIDLPESVKLDAVIFTNVKKTLMWQNGGMVASVVDCIRRLLKY
jgi:hypothetical protein